MVDADFLAGVVGYAVVGSGFRLDDASETAVGCQAFLRDLVRMKPSGAPGGLGVVGSFTYATAPGGESCRVPTATKSDGISCGDTEAVDPPRVSVAE